MFRALPWSWRWCSLCRFLPRHRPAWETLRPGCRNKPPTLRRQLLSNIFTVASQAPTLDGKFTKTHLAAYHDRWPEAKRGYEDLVHLSMSTYIPPVTLSLLKGAVYGWKGDLFAPAYQEHDPALVWCGYLGNARVVGDSDLPEILRKMGLQ